MTDSLRTAIDRLQQLPEERQELLAQLVLHEMDEDEKWSRSTAKHAEKLKGLMDEVLEADRRGQCEPLDPDKL